MEENILYSDKLVVIKDDEISFHNYYFPTFFDKTVKYSEVEKIEILKPTLLNGKYRYWGTGDFLHWYPMDMRRSRREVIFILYRKGKRIKIGFTVEDAEKVTEILKNKAGIRLN